MEEGYEKQFLNLEGPRSYSFSAISNGENGCRHLQIPMSFV